MQAHSSLGSHKLYAISFANSTIRRSGVSGPRKVVGKECVCVHGMSEQ